MDWRIALSHHRPSEEGARCVHLPGMPALCRRCLLLYPLTVAVMIAGVAGYLPIPPAFVPYLLLMAPLPATALFILEQLGLIPYRPWQIWLGTPPLALALGLGFARYLRAPGDALFWGMVLFYGLPAFAAALHRGLSAGGDGDAPSDVNGAST